MNGNKKSEKEARAHANKLAKLTGEWVPSDKSQALNLLGLRVTSIDSTCDSNYNDTITFHFSGGRFVRFYGLRYRDAGFQFGSVPKEVSQTLRAGKHTITANFRVTKDLGNGRFEAVVSEVSTKKGKRK